MRKNFDRGVMNSDPIEEHKIMSEIARGVELSTRVEAKSLGLT